MTKDGTIKTEIKVLTWNIWWRFGPFEARQPGILATLRTLDADIIALQEVWSDEETNLAAIFAEALGYHHAFEPAMEIDGFGFGNAVLSRWPIRDSASEALSGREETGEDRLVLYAEVDGPRGSIPVFTTHLTWRPHHGPVRQRQVAEICRFIEKTLHGDGTRQRTFPPLLCGDLNAEPMSDEIRMLRGLAAPPVKDLVFNDAWIVAGGGGPGITWDNRNPFIAPIHMPDRRIDYILSGMAMAGGAGYPVSCRIIGDQPVDGVWPSDHFGLLAELRY